MTILIELIFGIVFIALISKAIFDTIWGLCLITYGVGCHIVAAILMGMHWTVIGFRRLRRLRKSRRVKHSLVTA